MGTDTNVVCGTSPREIIGEVDEDLGRLIQRRGHEVDRGGGFCKSIISIRNARNEAYSLFYPH